jgi:hypothetical protein
VGSFETSWRQETGASRESCASSLTFELESTQPVIAIMLRSDYALLSSARQA